MADVPLDFLGAEQPHDVLSAAERAEGRAAADGLAQRRQVGIDAEVSLARAGACSQAAHLVEDEDYPVP